MHFLFLLIILLLLLLLYYYFNSEKFSSEQIVIPKLLHQTYSSRENLSEQLNKTIEENIKLNKGWKYKFYDNNDIDNYIKNNESEYVYSAFKKINPKFGASLADFFRYVVLYHSGGVYMDIKCKCEVPLDSWIESDKLQLSFWTKHNNYSDCNQYHLCKLNNSKNREITQMALIFPKKHPLMREVIDTMVEGIYNYKETDLLISDKVLYTTGPWLFTKVVAKYACKNLDKVKIWDNDFYNGYIITDSTNGEFTQNEIKTNKYYKNLHNELYII